MEKQGDNMSSTLGQKRKRTTSEGLQPLHTPQARHPYLTGNFAPIDITTPLTRCSYTGEIPPILAGGEYVRNGSNPVTNEDLGRSAHWFDGDGMLSGVSFRFDDQTRDIHPEFVNSFILTDLYLSAISSPKLRVPILPSIATLVDPLASIIYVTLRILRTVLLVLLSHLPGSRQTIKKISVANTNVVYHDGRALALCESGPPMRIQLPSLDTVGWYNGAWAEGESARVKENDEKAKGQEDEKVLGQDGGLIKFMREWTTAHPKVDPVTKEMLLFHASFAPPYVQYSIIPQGSKVEAPEPVTASSKLLNAPVPGVKGAKMMHDFGVSSQHTVIMDLPLTLDPLNQLKGLPPVLFNADKPSRFGVFPRRHPDKVRWFETGASCIFHTANTWDTVDACGRTSSVNMLACRLTSATLVFIAGNVAPPAPKRQKAIVKPDRRMPFFSKYDDGSDEALWERAPLLETSSADKERCIISTTAIDDSSDLESDPFSDEQCRLYYYCFDLESSEVNTIRHQWALSALPFEFPSVRPDREMAAARYVYGCSTTTTSFGSALGKATKIDALVKMDVATLIRRGRAQPPKSITGVVDQRSMQQVLESTDPHDPIRVFRLPTGWFAQEPRFVPASDNTAAEDDGYLLFYVYNEAQLLESGDVPPDNLPSRSTSELWILNAKDMKSIVAKIHLPQRVPYGLHGSWFSAEQIAEQRPVESLRSVSTVLDKPSILPDGKVPRKSTWMCMRGWMEGMLG